MSGHSRIKLAIAVAAACTACADAPQKRALESPSTSAEAGREELGAEPGAAKNSRACTSLGMAKEGAQPSNKDRRDVAGAARELERAQASFTAGDYAAALDAYQRATLADPFQGLAHLGVAEAHLYVDNDHGAMKLSLGRALELLPANPRAHLRAGELAAETGEAARAEAHFRCALELRPDYADARKRLAKQLYDAERFAEAEEIVAALATAEDVEAVMLHADVLEAEKKYLDAAQRVERAAELVKTSAPLWRRAANLYESAGSPPDAKRARELADKLDPPKKERELRPLPKARR